MYQILGMAVATSGYLKTIAVMFATVVTANNTQSSAVIQIIKERCNKNQYKNKNEKNN